MGFRGQTAILRKTETIRVYSRRDSAQQTRTNDKLLSHGGGTMNPSCLQYALTETEKRQFEEQGFIIVEDALAPDHVGRLTALCDAIHALKVAEGFDPKKALFYPNFIPDDPAFA